MTVVLYKVPGPKKIDGVMCDSVFVTEDEVDTYVADGWVLGGPHAALEAQENTPPTRAELETKATELGIEFDGRTSDAKLSARIAEKVG